MRSGLTMTDREVITKTMLLTMTRPRWWEIQIFWAKGRHLGHLANTQKLTEL